MKKIIGIVKYYKTLYISIYSILYYILYYTIYIYYTILYTIFYILYTIYILQKSYYLKLNEVMIYNKFFSFFYPIRAENIY